MSRSAIAALALLLTPALLAAQTTIGASGGGTVSPFGQHGTNTYGQTFTTPAVDTQLDGFSFWLGSSSTVTFRAYVYEWDGAAQRATGSALFTSAVMSAPSAGGFGEVSVSTGGVSLTPGGTFIAFLSAPGEAGSGSVQWEASRAHEYTGGAFVYFNNQTKEQWTTQSWDGGSGNHLGAGGDVRFEMTFSAGDVTPVPEPATVALMGGGRAVLGLGALRRRRSA